MPLDHANRGRLPMYAWDQAIAVAYMSEYALSLATCTCSLASVEGFRPEVLTRDAGQ